MVGDSVRGSLRKLAVQRLGQTDYAIISAGFFADGLAGRIADDSGFRQRFQSCVSGILLRGGATDDAADHIVAGVQIVALSGWVEVPADHCIINGELADDLRVAQPGKAIRLKLPSLEDLPREAALARRAANEVTTDLPLEVSSIARGTTMAAMFNPAGGQRAPRIVWVNLRDLQRAIGQPRRTNMLLVQSRGDTSDAKGACAAQCDPSIGGAARRPGPDRQQRRQ